MNIINNKICMATIIKILISIRKGEKKFLPFLRPTIIIHFD